MGTKKNADQGKQIDTQTRREWVIQQRQKGLTYRAIARAATKKFGPANLPKGWDELYAYKDIQRELERLKASVRDSAKDYLQMELIRLDALLSALWPDAMAGGVGAVDRVIKIMDRRAKYLGLDAPIGLVHSGGVDVDMNIHASRFDDWLFRQIQAHESEIEEPEAELDE